MTKTDKIYKVRCTYDTTSRNITFGMMPIRDPDMISITSAPEAPAPKIRILDTRNQEVETVRIGDRLTFRIEIPDKTPYGIFARSCVAMAKVTIHILRKHFYSTKLNLTRYLIFQKRKFFFRQKENNLFFNIAF
jgi:hypothetical protein